MSQISNNLVVNKLLYANSVLIHNFIAKFGKILDIHKRFAGNRVNKYGNVPRRGAGPKLSDLEAFSLSATDADIKKAPQSGRFCRTVCLRWD